MATYITQQTLLKRLNEKGIKISRQSLFNYVKRGVFTPTRTIQYGTNSFPLYEENDVNKLYNLIVRRYKSKKIRHKGIFLNELPDRSN